MALYFVNSSDFPLLALVVEPVGTISLKDRKNTLFSLISIRKSSVLFLNGTVTGGTKILVNRTENLLFLLSFHFLEFCLDEPVVQNAFSR